MNLSHDIWKKVPLLCTLGLVVLLVLGGERTPGYAQDIPLAAKAEIEELVEQVREEAVEYISSRKATMVYLKELKEAAQNSQDEQEKRWLWAAYWTGLERLATSTAKLQVAVLNEELPSVVRVNSASGEPTYDPIWRFRKELRDIASRYDVRLSLVEEEFRQQSKDAYAEMAGDITEVLTALRAAFADLAGHDNLTPVLEIVKPTEGECYSGIQVTFHDQAPRYEWLGFGWKYGWVWGGEKRTSGIDLESFQASAGGVDVTDELRFSPNGAIGYPSIPEGQSVTLEVRVKDFAGNETVATVKFMVDRTPPAVAIGSEDFVEVDGQYFSASNTPTIAADYSDAVSGIDTKTIEIILDTVGELTPFAEVGLNQTVLEVPQSKKLPEGMNVVTASIRDRCGNEGSASAAFVVDTVAPNVTILEPLDGWVLSTLSTSYRVRLGDLTSGLNEVTVNGASVYLDEEQRLPGADVVIEGVVALQEGENTFRVVAEDKAGNTRVAQTVFSVVLPAPSGLEILPDISKTKKYQSGLVGRCVGLPLLVRAYDAENPECPLEGVSLVLEVVEGEGLFLDADGYSTVTDAEGVGGIRFICGATPGVNKVRISMPGGGDGEEAPSVDFFLTGELPIIQAKGDFVIVNGVASLEEEIPGSAFGELLGIAAEWSQGALAGEQVRYELVEFTQVQVNGNTYWAYEPVDEPESLGTFLPANTLTNEDGEAKTAFVIDDNALGNETEKTVYLRASLLDFVDPETGQAVCQLFEGTIKEAGPEDTERVVSGNGQTGVKSNVLSTPFIARCENGGGPWPTFNGDAIEFHVSEGGGYLEFAVGAGFMVLETDENGNAVRMQVDVDNEAKAGVKLVFGSENEVHLVSAHATGGVHPTVFTVFFAACPPEVRFVEEITESTGEFQELDVLKPGLFVDPSTDEMSVNQANRFFVEMKYPIGGFSTMAHTLSTLDFYGNPVDSVEGAIAPVEHEIALSKVEETERYSLYRSEPVIATRIRTGRVVPMITAPTGEKLIQLLAGRGIKTKSEVVENVKKDYEVDPQILITAVGGIDDSRKPIVALGPYEIRPGFIPVPYTQVTNRIQLNEWPKDLSKNYIQIEAAKDPLTDKPYQGVEKLDVEVDSVNKVIKVIVKGAADYLADPKEEKNPLKDGIQADIKIYKSAQKTNKDLIGLVRVVIPPQIFVRMLFGEMSPNGLEEERLAGLRARAAVTRNRVKIVADTVYKKYTPWINQNTYYEVLTSGVGKNAPEFEGIYNTKGEAARTYQGVIDAGKAGGTRYTWGEKPVELRTRYPENYHLCCRVAAEFFAELADGIPKGKYSEKDYYDGDKHARGALGFLSPRGYNMGWVNDQVSILIRSVTNPERMSSTSFDEMHDTWEAARKEWLKANKGEAYPYPIAKWYGIEAYKTAFKKGHQVLLLPDVFVERLVVVRPMPELVPGEGDKDYRGKTIVDLWENPWTKIKRRVLEDNLERVIEEVGEDEIKKHEFGKPTEQ